MILQRNTDAYVLCSTAVRPQRIHHGRQHFYLLPFIFCSCAYQNLSRNILYNHIKQLRKQQQQQDPSFYLVNGDGYNDLVKLMRWSQPPTFTLPAPTHTQPLRLKPYRIPKHRTNLPAPPARKLTRRHCMAFTDSIEQTRGKEGT